MIRRSLTALSLLVLAFALVACPAVRGRRGAPEESGFLGDYSQLKKIEGRPAQLVYINPNAEWTRYDAVQIDSVTLWSSQEIGKLTDQERQMLTDLLFTALHEDLSAQFRVVDQPSPDTLRLRAAVTDAKGSNVPVRTITTILPQALLLGAATGLSMDTTSTVGTATVEAEVKDSITGRRLAAAVDQRAGVKSLVSGNTFKKWGDVEAACRYWAHRVTGFLVEQGVQRKPGAPPFKE